MWYLKDGLPSKIAKKLKAWGMASVEAAFVSLVWKKLVDKIWDLLGFGSCKELWDNRNKGIS